MPRNLLRGAKDLTCLKANNVKSVKLGKHNKKTEINYQRLKETSIFQKPRNITKHTKTS